MSDLGTMVARIDSELNQPALVSRIQPAILSAIKFYEDERFWFLQSEDTITTVAGTQSYSPPSDAHEIDIITLTDNNIRYPLTRRTWTWFRQRNLDSNVTARPDDWTYWNSLIWLRQVPDKAYTLTVSYLADLSAMTSFTDTNAWMTHGEELIRNRAKYDLVQQPPIADMKLVNFYDQRTTQALRKLRSRSHDIASNPRLSLDDTPVTNRHTAYNINYE